MSAMVASGQYALTPGYGPALNITERAVARVSSLAEAAEVAIKQVEDGGDYVIITPSTRRRPYLHQLGIGFLLAAVQGTGHALIVTTTLGVGPGVAAVFDERHVPQALRRAEAALSSTWNYYTPADLYDAHRRVKPTLSSDAARALLQHCKMVAGEVELGGSSAKIGTGSATSRQPVTASVLLQEGRAVHMALLDAPVDTTVTSSFNAMYGGEHAVCEIKMRSHGNIKDQATTRAAWTGQSGGAVELNPPWS